MRRTFRSLSVPTAHMEAIAALNMYFASVRCRSHGALPNVKKIVWGFLRNPLQVAILRRDSGHTCLDALSLQTGVVTSIAKFEDEVGCDFCLRLAALIEGVGSQSIFFGGGDHDMLTKQTEHGFEISAAPPPSQAKQTTHIFKPGEMGAICDDKGIVREVRFDSQACAKRILKGWQIAKVGAETYSNVALIKAESCGTDYEITFKVGNDSGLRPFWVIQSGQVLPALLPPKGDERRIYVRRVKDTLEVAAGLGAVVSPRVNWLAIKIGDGLSNDVHFYEATTGSKLGVVHITCQLPKLRVAQDSLMVVGGNAKGTCVQICTISQTPFGQINTKSIKIGGTPLGSSVVGDMLWVIVSWQGFALVYRLGLAGEIDIIARCPHACSHALAPISTWLVLGVESASALELFLYDVHAHKCLLALWSAKGRRPTMVPLSICWRTVQRFNDLLACTSKRNRMGRMQDAVEHVSECLGEAPRTPSVDEATRLSEAPRISGVSQKQSVLQ